MIMHLAVPQNHQVKTLVRVPQMGDSLHMASVRCMSQRMKTKDPIRSMASKNNSVTVEKEIRDQAKQTAKSGV